MRATTDGLEVSQRAVIRLLGVLAVAGVALGAIGIRHALVRVGVDSAAGTVIITATIVAAVLTLGAVVATRVITRRARSSR